MKNEVRILLLEDSAPDAKLIQEALLEGGLRFTMQSVATKQKFLDQLEQKCPDVILSDFNVPAFDGFEALQEAQERCPDAPFIFVTGTLGDEVAIDSLKKGATDYVLKHRMGRLVPSVHRALREARERSERKRAEAQLREAHEQSRALSVYLQYVREEERIRIAREIHDELGQQLTGLKLQMMWIASRLSEEQKPLRDKSRELMHNVDETIQAVRRIATELRPSVLDSAGLPAAIEWQARQFEGQTGIPCRVKSSVQETMWDQDLNTAFFRIFQETLTNIIRHAAATAVEVHLCQDKNDFVLKVRDNGIGILENEIQNTRSIGLLGMRERAALLGGNVRWVGVPGEGTTVMVRIPRPGGALKKNDLLHHEDPSHRRSRRRAAGVETHSC
jgi:signal transduction histidine kinase